MADKNAVFFRGTRYLRSVLAEDGKGNATQIAQVYRMFSGQGDLTGDMAARIVYSVDTTDMSAELLDARVVQVIAFSRNPDPFAEQPKWVPEEVGWIRAVDMVMDVFSNEDADKVRRAIGKVASKVRGAIKAHQKLSVDDRMADFLGQDWVQEAMKEAMGYESTIVRLKELVKELRDKVTAEAKKEVHPLAQFYGGELTVLWTDTDLAGKERDAAVPYIETFPVKFELTRADCGEERIYGITEEDEEHGYKCTVTQAGEEFVGYPTARATKQGNPKTNCVMVALKKLVKARGGDPATVSYNVKKTLYHWDKLED